MKLLSQYFRKPDNAVFWTVAIGFFVSLYFAQPGEVDPGLVGLVIGLMVGYVIKGGNDE